MDWGQRIFLCMYKATSLLVGAASHKAAGVPTLFRLLLDKAAVNALPATPGVMTGIAAPGLALSFHSGHALVLYTAIRADRKYSEQRKQLNAIYDAMKKFAKDINMAIKRSPVPRLLPSMALNLKSMPGQQQVDAYTGQVDDAVKHTRAFVSAQDIVLKEIRRCINEWNQFLLKQKQFLNSVKIENTFDEINYRGLTKQRDLVHLDDAISFDGSVRKLVTHRNRWGRLLDLPVCAVMPRMQF